MKILALIALFLASGCSSAAKEAYPVSPTDYAVNRACWFNAEGDFVAFLIVSRTGNAQVPHFISARCYVNEQGNDTTSNYLNSLGIVDKFDVLKKHLKNGSSIVDNTSTDGALQIRDADVYAFKGRVSLFNISGLENSTIYQVDSIEFLKKWKYDYESLVRMPPRGRIALADSLLDFQ